MSGGTTGTVATPATPIEEPLTVAEVMDYCQIDQSNQEPAPTAPTVALLSPAAAGNVNTGAHRYRVTFVTADGETEGGIVTDGVTVADSAVNGKVYVTGIPIGGSKVTSRKLYRTAAGGSEYLLLATIANNTDTSYTDNIADGSLGAGCPTTNTTSDPMLSMFIAAARAAAESELHRHLITQTRRMYFDRFPVYDKPIQLPPSQSVTSITYLDADGVRQTLSAADYVVETDSVPTRIFPAYGLSWPNMREETNSVIVTYVAGYGARADVPQCIKTWMLLRIRSMYDNRSAVVSGTIVQAMPNQYVDGLLDSERVSARI